jgi:glyceraldehyde 3-phosphate dehydrogenase
MIRVAINGFGRIGRSVFKAGFDRDDVEFVALNDLAPNESLAYLLRYDTVYGRYHHEVTATEEDITVNGKKIDAFSIKNPSELPWKDLDIDVVIESTGVFRDEEGAKQHIDAGAKRVVISAPNKGGNINTYVLGVNDTKHNANELIIDNASCTTNCIAPVAAIMHGNFGVEKAMMTTIHAYTADQALVDGPHRKDPRRGRSAAQNIVPTSTGAAKATANTIPELQGIFDGMAIRVPVPVGSLSDFTFLLGKDATPEDINAVIKESADKNPLYKNIVSYTEDPIVSSDIIGNPHSSIVDLSLTKVVGGNLAKIVAWYDNEWGYSNRLIEMVVEVGQKLKK